MIHTAKASPPPPVDCAEVLAKYPVESYNDQKGKKTGVYKDKQSHHIIGNAHFQSPRGTNVPGICPGYSEDDAPCIPLLDDTNPRTEHGKASKAQKAAGKRHRRSGKNPTYQDARQDAKDQLQAKPKPGLSEEEAECILVKVDEYFEKTCGPLEGKQLRAPGSRKKWKPDIKKTVKKSK